MEQQELQTQVKQVLEVIKAKSFVTGYKASDAEAMGLLIAHYFEWDGIQIMEATAGALEDANFHGECAQVTDMLNKVKKQFPSLGAK